MEDIVNTLLVAKTKMVVKCSNSVGRGERGDNCTFVRSRAHGVPEQFFCIRVRLTSRAECTLVRFSLYSN